MSALRRKQTCAVHQLMSALVPESDRESEIPASGRIHFTPKSGHVRALTHVRFVPIADNVR